MVYNKWFADWLNLPLQETPITAEFLEHVETALDTQDDRIVTLESETDGHTIQDEGAALAQRANLNFVGTGVTVTDNSANNRTDVSIAGGGSGHTIQDEGAALAQRANLNFVGTGVTVTDDSANARTNVTIPGGGGGLTVQDEGTGLTQRTSLNFVGTGVTATDDATNSRTTVTIPGGAGHTIQDENVSRPQRGFLNFLGSGVTTADDSANNRTNVTIPGAGAGAGDPVGFITLDTGSQSTAGTAINNAIAALPSNGGTILIPAGTWIIDTGIRINKLGVILQGVGNYATELQYNPATVSTVIKNADTTRRSITIRDLLIDPTGASGGTAIDLSDFASSTVDGVRIGQGTTQPKIGIDLNHVGTYYNVIRNCQIRFGDGTAGGYGIRIINVSNSNEVDNVRFYPTDTFCECLYINDAHTQTITHVDCENAVTGVTTPIGIHIGSSGHNVTLVGPYLEAMEIGIQLDAGVQGFACFGGFIGGGNITIQDNGAIGPSYVGLYRAYASYSKVAEEEFQRESWVMKDIGATTISTFGMATPTLSGTLANADDGSAPLLTHTTTAVANNTAGIISTFNQARRDWNSRVDMTIKTPTDLTSIRMLAGFFDESPDAVPVAATVAGGWFRYDTSLDGTAFWRCVSSDGTTSTVTTTTVPVNASDSLRMTVQVLQTGIGFVNFYIDRILVAKHSTPIPANSDTLGYGIRVTTLTAATRNIRWGHIRLLND